MIGFKEKLALNQNPIAFGILECSAGVSPASVRHLMSGETPDLHELFGKSKILKVLVLPGSWGKAASR